MRKKGKNIGGWFILRSVGNKAVDILFVMGNDRKSLPDELVGYSVENIKSLDPLLYSHLTHQKYIRIK